VPTTASWLGSSFESINGDAGAGKRDMAFMILLAVTMLWLTGKSFTTCWPSTSPMSAMALEASSAAALHPSTKAKARTASMVWHAVVLTFRLSKSRS